MKVLSIAMALLLGAVLAVTGCRRRGDEERWWLDDEGEPGGEEQGLIEWALALVDREYDPGDEEPGLAEWGLEEEDGLVYEVDYDEPFTGILDEQWHDERQKLVEIGFRDGVPYGKITEWEDYGFEQRQETEFLDGKVISHREWDEYGNLITEWFYW